MSNVIYLSSKLQHNFGNSDDVFANIMAIEGKVYRQVPTRQTLRFTYQSQQHDQSQTYFIKKHFGVGWREIIKCLCYLRWPVISAINECRAIKHLQKQHLQTPVIAGFGKRGLNPARMQSFIITQALQDVINLDELTMQWRQSPPRFNLKFTLIKALANTVRCMHASGLNHRDCYLMHFYIKQQELNNLNNGLLNNNDLQLIILDLHRAQIRSRVPRRWRLKDLIGLYFSSKEITLTTRDYYRFIKAYRQMSLRQILIMEKHFWQQIRRKGEVLYNRTPIR